MPPIPAPREHGFTPTTDVPLYWARYGPPGAPRLLVLHGGPGAHHDYLLPQLLELSDDYELVFYDQRGGGQSRTDDREPITWQTHVADLDRVIASSESIRCRSSGTRGAGCSPCCMQSRRSAGRATHPPRRLVLIDPAPVNRDYRREFEAEFARRQAGADVAALREELAQSGLRERDPEAYRQRNFELSVAGYFAHPSAARDLTPFRVTGRVQQSVWDSLGDFDLLAPWQLGSVVDPRADTPRAPGSHSARVVQSGGRGDARELRRDRRLGSRSVR